MSDLISRSAAIQSVRDYDDFSWTGPGWERTINEVIDILINLSPVPDEPTKECPTDVLPVPPTAPDLISRSGLLRVLDGDMNDELDQYDKLSNRETYLQAFGEGRFTAFRDTSLFIRSEPPVAPSVGG